MTCMSFSISSYPDVFLIQTCFSDVIYNILTSYASCISLKRVHAGKCLNSDYIIIFKFFWQYFIWALCKLRMLAKDACEAQNKTNDFI